MKSSPLSWFVLSIALAAGSPVSARATADVTFAAEDLNALLQLGQPRKTSLRLDGRRGEFRPGPSLLFIGVENQNFDIDLDVGSILDLRFNSLRSNSLTFRLENGRVRLALAIEDQEKAIRSALGSISVKNVAIEAWFRLAADGSPYFVYDEGAISGELKGTGLLRPQWVIDAVRKAALKSLRDQLESQIAHPGFRKAIEDGMIIWSRFSVDERLTHVVKGSASISATAIRFKAE